MRTVKKIFYVIGVLLVLAVMVLLCTALMQIGMGVLGESMQIAISEDTLYSLSGTLGIALTSIFFAGYAVRKRKLDSNESVEKQPFDVKKAIIYGLLAICVCHIFFSFITTILFSQIFPITYEQTQSSSIYMDILCGLILAPISEEALFRLGLYSLLKRQLKEKSAIVLCALIFGVMHGYNALGVVSCCLAGLVFTLIYERTGNIWYSILAHAMCNLHSLIFNTLERKGIMLFGGLMQYEVNGYNMYHAVVIVAAVLFCAAIGYFYKKRLTRA